MSIIIWACVESFSKKSELFKRGSERLVNQDKSTNKIEHHKQTYIPIDALLPCINMTPDKSIPINIPSAFSCDISLHLDLRFPYPHK